MHMADALISPAAGGAMWAVSAGALVYSARKIKQELDDSKVPLMGVMGAFVFAAQMINFTIPGTGSSGHLGGSILLAALLGPYAAFLTMAAILTVQALFFADGGLLALGCNIFNMGFLPCFVAYPLLYKPLAAKGRFQAGVVLAAVIGLQLGALGVVVETVYSGITELPPLTFLLLMQPIHLAIGLVEGMVTAAVLLFIRRERPELFVLESRTPRRSLRPVLIGMLAAALLTGGVLSWFASASPDGLEWSLARATGQEELQEPQEGIYGMLGEWQKKLALFPGYNFRGDEEEKSSKGEESWPAVNGGTSVAGIAGGIFTMLLLGAIGRGLKIARNV